MSSPPQPTTIFRPWPQFFSGSTVSLPISLSEATDRLSTNLRYYLPNYTLIILVIFLFSLLPLHLLSLIFYLILSASFAYLYLLRTQPLEVFGYDVDDKILVISLSALGVVGLFFGWLWGNLFVAVAIGGGLSVIHAVMKAPEEGVEGSPYGALLSESDGGGGEYFRV